MKTHIEKFRKLNRLISLVLLMLLISCSATQRTDTDASLMVSKNGRYLQKPDGTPFLYLGDTAWELFHKLSREEADHYLKNRAEKGFTVIQAVVLAEMQGLTTGNAYGDLPLIGRDPAKPNEKYFEHVDYIVNKAEELGLFIGMLPTWGDKVTAEHGGEGVIFTPENAEIYGKFLGERYADKPVIWILGGDRQVTNDTVFEIWQSMAKGITEGDKGLNLISYHPRGGSMSYYWYHNEPWLDFNMYQSGHEKRFNEVYRYAKTCYLLNPVKPYIDGEPAYEDIPVRFWEYLDWSDPMRVPEGVLDSSFLVKDRSHFEKGFFTGYDLRIHAYWNLLSGACGYTYGNNAIWQMYEKGESFAIPALYDWKESLDRPGADDMRHVRALFETRLFSKLIPDQSIVYGVNPRNEDHIRAARAEDGTFLLVYIAKGQEVTVYTDKIDDDVVVGWWFNPRNGEALPTEEITERIQSFTPPTSGLDNDWMLVLDSETLALGTPGDL